MSHVERELDWAQLLQLRQRWPEAVVTNKPIEECAAEIVDLQRRRLVEDL